jgi:hypothetical protein
MLDIRYCLSEPRNTLQPISQLRLKFDDLRKAWNGQVHNSNVQENEHWEF